MRSHCRFVALAAAAAMVACSGRAPDLQLSGKVTSTGAPLLNAKVSIAPHREPGELRKLAGIPEDLETTTTRLGADGAFAMNAPSSAEYFLLVEHAGCGSGGNLQIIAGCSANCVRDLRIDPKDCD